jgi:hypothetical protein
MPLQIEQIERAQVQLGIAALADIQAAQLQAERGERCAAAPADYGVGPLRFTNLSPYAVDLRIAA